MENRDKIKGKIQALLLKTIDNGATKEEMESALNKANQLMTMFFISENELKDESIINRCVSKSFNIEKSGFDFTMFFSSLATLFDCKYYYNSKRIVFFGYDLDVDLCGYFFYLITRTCVLEKARYLKTKEYSDLKKFYHGRSLSANFIRGFLYEITIKMEAMYLEKQSNIPQTFGLLVIEKKELINNEFEALDLTIKKKKSKTIDAENMAFNHGSVVGQKLELIQGISTNTENCLKLEL